jgi:ATP-dependent Clp protease ATP-binding subunit ClpB
LKPALARGDLHLCGATTLKEYRKYIEKDAALARRFQPVLVSEPSVQDTITILRGLKEKYEVHHGCRISDSALVAAATMSERYIPDRFLPDKAIDLVDEAASRLKLQQESKPEVGSGVPTLGARSQHGKADGVSVGGGAGCVCVCACVRVFCFGALTGH